MVKVLADAHLSQRLREARETVQVIDDLGHTLGFFDPLTIAAPGVARARSPYSNEQVEELRKQTGGRSLADILRDLEQRG
jgi:hypothetical protein